MFLDRQRVGGWSLLVACSAILHAQSPATPRAGAGYLLPDGSVQIIAQQELVPLVEQMDALFAQQHPGTRIIVRGGDNYSAMSTLTFDVSAVAPMTSEYTRIGIGNNLKIGPEPVPVRIAHASLKPGTTLSPLVVIVNRKNPLAQLSLDQLVRTFTVGGPVGDITRWSQLGVKGELAMATIDPTGPPSGDYFPFDDPQVGEFLGTRIFNGLNLAHSYTPEPHYADIVARVAQDPEAIGITTSNTVTPEVKVITLAGRPNGPKFSASPDDIAAGRYPLDRYVYLYLRSNPEVTLDPFAAQYLQTVLSPEGQRIVANSAAGFIPLNSREVAEELAKVQR